MASISQISKIQVLRRQLSMDHEQLLNHAEDVAGRNINNLEELSISEASELIDKLEGD